MLPLRFIGKMLILFSLPPRSEGWGDELIDAGRIRPVSALGFSSWMFAKEHGNIMITSHYDETPAHLRSILMHFTDLREGTHGDGAVSRIDKEELFVAAVGYLAPYARQALEEMNGTLLLSTGTIAAADLHNLVFQSDYLIIPATTRTSGRSKAT